MIRTILCLACALLLSLRVEPAIERRAKDAVAFLVERGSTVFRSLGGQDRSCVGELVEGGPEAAPAPPVPTEATDAHSAWVRGLLRRSLLPDEEETR